jgi:hypothetical protein
MARAAFPIADRVSLADVGEYVTQINGGSHNLALLDIQAALVGGCRSLLRWIKDGQEKEREYPPSAFWRPFGRLAWEPPFYPQGWKLVVRLPWDEFKGDELYPFLCLTDAVRWGLWPASELPQAKQQSEPQQPPPATQPDEPAITDPALAASARHSVDETKQTSADLKRIAPASAPATDVGDQAKAETAETVTDGYQITRVREHLKRLYHPASVPSRADVGTSALRKKLIADQTFKAELRQKGLRDPSWQTVNRARDGG